MWKSATRAALLVVGLGGAAALSGCDEYYYPYTYGYGPPPPAYRGYTEAPATNYGGDYSAAPTTLAAPGTTVSILGCPARTSAGCDVIRDVSGVAWDVTRADTDRGEFGRYALQYTGRVSPDRSCTGGPSLEDVTWTRTDRPC
jgi:hypothetical protein